MTNNILVSVNITTFNRANLIPRCLDSVLKQSLKNIEIIIVDDCSNDNTSDIVSSYKIRDSRIRYFKHDKNRGNANSRNTALKHSNGFYVAFLDDDDEWIDNFKLEKQVNLFECGDNKIGIICSGIERVQSYNKTIKEIVQHPSDIKFKVLKGGLIHNSTVLTKKKIISDVGGFDVNVQRGIDSEFFRRVIVKHNYKVIFMKDITCRYYENSSNRMTATNNCSDLIAHAKSQIINIKKYFKYLIFRPTILLYRVKVMLIFLLKFAWFKIKT